MFFSRWPVFKTFLALCVAGFAYQLLPSRLGNERMVDDFVQIGAHLFAGQSQLAYTAIREGYAPFLPARAGNGQTAHKQVASVRTSTPRQMSARGGREVRVKAGRNNHFYVSPRVNGRATDFVIDTGASMVAIRYEDAQRLGLKITPADFTAEVRTANGSAYFAPVVIERIELEGILVRNVPGAVGPRGALSENLLGMSFLRELSDVRFNGNEILLVE